MKNRVDIIAKAVRSYGVEGKGVDASELAEWIDEALRQGPLDTSAWDEGYEAGLQDEA